MSLCLYACEKLSRFSVPVCVAPRVCRWCLPVSVFMAVPVPTSAFMFMPMSERLTQPLDTNGSNSCR